MTISAQANEKPSDAFMKAMRAPNMRRPGSMIWAGINNTFYWIDPASQIGVVVLMQILPFYDDAAISILQGVEPLVYQHSS